MDENLFYTNVSMFALWDSASFSYLRTQKDYFDNFVEDKNILELINAGTALVWSPGTKGNFPIITRIESKLTKDEEKRIHKKSLGHKFISTGKNIYIGSPEWVGYKEQEGIDGGFIGRIPLEEGTYSVDIYCLLTRQNFEAFLDYVLLIKKVSETYPFEVVKEVPLLTYY